MSKPSQKNYSRFQNEIGYKFKNIALLERALTHSSYANENRAAGVLDNERFEFLGDSILGMNTALYLFNKYPDEPEGELTKMRSSLVCTGALCDRAKAISLGDELRLGHGEESGGGRERPSILADAFEAVIGAIYLDSGEESARSFIKKFVFDAEKGGEWSVTDYKTTLQEIVQKNRGEMLSYHVIESNGPDHERSFTVEVMINSNHIGTGHGHSKKEAEQMAAREALKLMGMEQ
ncbi:MAG: ribonuclease III [Oscillospiraceae bacterium]|nr:ribonuclease III [Oscillospiraceae bacterium]MBQ2742518.1 ribonuclease III [Oscillospiraceae bacterium]MBQ3224963.1 ribonuclease III [Oscillospiraceae bacterium]MBQ4316142.1 ribonuclease III [Oscillospiraceae bacterium]MBQ6697574.1 ribonuclease III [Oscillospiraceae bacterium]